MAQKNYNILTVADTTVLSTKGKGDALQVLVTDIGVFNWEGAGTPDAEDVFAANGGGVWVRKLKPGSGGGGTGSVYETIAQLKENTGDPNELVTVLGYYAVNDGGGGLYYWNNSSTTADNGGSVIQATSVVTGRWIGIFPDNLVNVRRFGAKGDGVQDDLPMFNAATTFALFSGGGRTLFIPSGVYRITDTWLIGYRAVQEPEIPFYDATLAPSFTTAGSPSVKNNLQIKGEDNSVIHGDFTSASLKAIVYYCIRTSGGASDAEFAPKIENIKIFGQGAYVGLTDQGLTTTQVAKNQIAFVSVLAYQIRIERLFTQNVAYGCITSNGYSSMISSYRSEYCEWGLYDVGSAASFRENLRIFYCPTGYTMGISSGITQCYNVWIGGLGCSTALRIINSSGAIIDGFYSEIDRVPGDTGATFDFGLDDTDPSFNGSLGSPSRIVVRGANVSASFTTSGRSNAVRLRATCGNVVFVTSNIVGSVIVDNAKFTRLIQEESRFAEGTITAPLRTIFQRDSFKSDFDIVKLYNRLEVDEDVQAGNMVYSKGVSLRGGATNLIRESDDFSVGWTKSSPVTWVFNAALNPYGTANDALALTTTETNRGLTHSLTPGGVTVELGKTYTYSVWARSASSNQIRLGIGNNGYTTLNVGTEWTRVHMTYTLAPDTLNHVTLTVIGVSLDPVYVWGAQLEQAQNPGTYISTGASPQTTPANYEVLESEKELQIKSRGKRISFKDVIKIEQNTSLPLPENGALEGIGSELFYTVGGTRRPLIPKTIGQAVFSGDGLTTTYNIPHGLGGAVKAVVTPGSLDSKNFHITSDANNIQVTFEVAPPVGTNNIILNWIANL